MTKSSDGSKPSHLKIASNEADFQASIVEEIRKALPLLPADLRVERYLNLKLGHHEVVIDGTSTDKKNVKGRSDVVVYRHDAPLLLAELKARHVKIVDEDVDQALSYARLHRPMVPLVLVTNGDPGATRFVLTYDGSSVPTDQADAVGLRKVLESASMLAATAVEGAIRGLLGNDPSVWREILDHWNSEAIASRTGSASDFRRAIAENFKIPREAVKSVSSCLNEGAPVVILHGLPLSGVTSAMTQLVQAVPDVPCVYIDSSNAGDVLQFISNRLSRELSVGISKDDLRQWLNTRQSLSGLTLLIDGCPSSAMEELLQFAEDGSLRIVLGLDSWAFSLLRTLPGRLEESSLARLARDVELTELSISEFGAAREILWKSFNSIFLPGAEIVADLRLPRTLRLMASQIPMKIARATRRTQSGDEQIAAFPIPPIPVIDMLELASSLFGANPQLKHDLSRLSAAFLIDVRKNGVDPDRITETFGVPSIDADVLETELGETRVQRLSDQGIIHWIDSRSLGPRIIVRLPELLAHHISLLWTLELNKASSDEEIVEKLDDVLRMSHFVPYGALCAAAAIARMGNGRSLHTIMLSLFGREPRASRLKEGAVIELLTTDRKGIRLCFGEGMDERVPGDMQPWLVLSHLAMRAVEGADPEFSINMAIFAQIGNSEDLIYAPPPGKFGDVVGFHFHDVPEIGSLLCTDSGIVEPLLQAMYFHALREPEEFEQLVKCAIDEKKAFLAWRLMTVARIVKNTNNIQASTAASQADAVLAEWWRKTFNTVASH